MTLSNSHTSLPTIPYTWTPLVSLSYWAKPLGYANLRLATPNQVSSTPVPDNLSATIYNRYPTAFLVLGALIYALLMGSYQLLVQMFSPVKKYKRTYKGAVGPSQLQTVSVINHTPMTYPKVPLQKKLTLAEVKEGLKLLGAYFKAYPETYSDDTWKIMEVGSQLTGDALSWFISNLEENDNLCTIYEEFKSQLLAAATHTNTRLESRIALMNFQQEGKTVEVYIKMLLDIFQKTEVDEKMVV